MLLSRRGRSRFETACMRRHRPVSWREAVFREELCIISPVNLIKFIIFKSFLLRFKIERKSMNLGQIGFLFISDKEKTFFFVFFLSSFKNYWSLWNLCPGITNGVIKLVLDFFISNPGGFSDRRERCFSSFSRKQLCWRRLSRLAPCGFFFWYSLVLFMPFPSPSAAAWGVCFFRCEKVENCWSNCPDTLLQQRQTQPSKSPFFLETKIKNPPWTKTRGKNTERKAKKKNRTFVIKFNAETVRVFLPRSSSPRRHFISFVPSSLSCPCEW